MYKILVLDDNGGDDTNKICDAILVALEFEYYTCNSEIVIMLN